MASKRGREGPGEINAGSMADIAFLLLIFFLVTTTMDMDSGILRKLPPPVPEDQDPPDVPENRVYKVKVNFKDQLLVNGEPMHISELKEGAKEFFTNPQNRDDLPKRQKVTASTCQEAIKKAKQALAQDSSNQDARQQLKKAEDRLEVVKTIGPYKKLPDDALISLRNDRGSSYDIYIQVQNELQAAVNELRHEFSMEKFGIPYDELKPNRNSEHRPMVLAVRKVYPQRISEAEPLDVKGKGGS